MSEASFRQAHIDVGAIRSNVRHLLSVTGGEGMAIVKANGYGHGAIPVGLAALEAGATWLGVADLTEAHELRTAGITAPILAWLHGPEADFADAFRQRIDVGVVSLEQLLHVAEAARSTGICGNIHVKVDTGLSRNGVPEEDWQRVARESARYEQAGVLKVRGLFSHLANASPQDDDDASVAFERARQVFGEAGLAPNIVNLAATAAALTRPRARHAITRLGIGLYGLSPCESEIPEAKELVPAMTLSAPVIGVRRIAPGTGVSYDYTFRASRDTTVVLVPLGYADGVPRSASGRGEVQIRGRRYPVCGRIAMDQFVVDVGDDSVAVGDNVTVFGDPKTGVPSASDWARWAGTINYEIVTRIGSRVTRIYEG